MKTREQIEKVIAIKEEELAKCKARLADLQVWIDSANFMQNPTLFISSVSEKKDLESRIDHLQVQIEAWRWTIG